MGETRIRVCAEWKYFFLFEFIIQYFVAMKDTLVRATMTDRLFVMKEFTRYELHGFNHFDRIDVLFI